MKNYFIKSFLFSERLQLIKEKKALYSTDRTNKEKVQYQVEKFNFLWGDLCENHPFYMKWAKKHNLPKQIKSVSDLSEFPVLTKKDIQDNRDLILPENGKFQVVATGGSSGEPTKFPTCKDEKNFEYANTYLGRSMYGVNPLDSTMLFWGHSHLFGSGLRGKLNELKRRLSDYLLNINRLNAYDLSINTVVSYCQKLKKNNPAIIIGYTSSIYKLAKYISENDLDIGDKSRLRGVILTSETITDADIKLVSKVFNVPVIVEYGMAETSVIAYSVGHEKNIEVFWDSFIARENNDGQLLVTTLNKRIFPLINYDTSDRVISKIKESESLLSFESIAGRTKDNVIVKCNNGSFIELSGILIVHILKGYPSVYSISYKQIQKGIVEVYVLSNGDDSVNNVTKYFLTELFKGYPSVSPCSFNVVLTESEEQTIAGKTIVNLG